MKERREEVNFLNLPILLKLNLKKKKKTKSKQFTYRIEKYRQHIETKLCLKRKYTGGQIRISLSVEVHKHLAQATSYRDAINLLIKFAVKSKDLIRNTNACVQ